MTGRAIDSHMAKLFRRKRHHQHVPVYAVRSDVPRGYGGSEHRILACQVCHRELAHGEYPERPDRGYPIDDSFTAKRGAELGHTYQFGPVTFDGEGRRL